ncbi:unnamed protein product [Arctia plantaginis]|uniref:Uncharacterized protein n=1 Tax=Arctia plantaginis TaxID=874455 RepID=A0A8S1B2C5_ARCPL|nr:unnamed protein product [Arctia plantaginis]CAB3256606.1 unnamed protein product [Arctia plantaginis]
MYDILAIETLFKTRLTASHRIAAETNALESGRLCSKELAGREVRWRARGERPELRGSRGGVRPALDTERSFNQLILFLNANSAI